MQIPSFLCLHTPRADCNVNLFQHQRNLVFASTRSVQIATTVKFDFDAFGVRFASTRSVQIATGAAQSCVPQRKLCLHTLRADCNSPAGARERDPARPLPPHAPCRLQPARAGSGRPDRRLCLHTLRADCNPTARWRSAGRCSFASTRSVQIATAEMHRMQYALFRTCVESVDSFSVLNKAMLR